MDATPPTTSPQAPRRKPGLRAQVVVLVVAVLVAALGAVIWSRTVADRGADDEVFILDTPGEFVDPSMTNPDVAGDPLPDVMVATADGERVALEPDGRPMVVNVWYASCPPCARELPYFQTVSEEFGDRVRFVGVNPQDTAERMTEFAEQRGVTYELLLDDRLELYDALRLLSFPVTLFVSADGEVVEQHGEVSEAELRAGVENLLA